MLYLFKFSSLLWKGAMSVISIPFAPNVYLNSIGYIDDIAIIIDIDCYFLAELDYECNHQVEVFFLYSCITAFKHVDFINFRSSHNCLGCGASEFTVFVEILRFYDNSGHAKVIVLNRVCWLLLNNSRTGASV